MRQVLAVRYGRRVTKKSESFLSYHAYGEPDAALAVDYYFWVIRDDDGTVTLVDTGFAPQAGRRRGREQWFTPAEALPVLGIEPASVRTVVITHAHWDHTGNLSQFPAAEIVMSQAEYDFWMSPVARRPLFALHSEEDELDLLATARKAGRLTLTQASSTQLRPGVQLIQVGGHTPGELIVTVGDEAGTVILASDALHHYEEVDRDRPYAVLSDLPDMYRAYDLLAELAAEPGARLVAGHDPQVLERFAPHPAHADACDLGNPLA
ncbi:MAG TPA: N-acyl homoserine lactonase family protein [Trebonia sp.]|nr:N-acyl homoserine lactonase family protein [Trebonia sp.]